MDEHKSNQKETSSTNCKTKQTYLCCAIIIISVIVIFQFVLLLYDNDQLAKQFSFASTITSIILSVIAIFMTVVSGNSTSDLLHKFRDLHDEIKGTPEKIEVSTREITGASKELNDSMGNVSSTIQKMDLSVSEMHDASDVLKQAVEQVNEVVKQINTSLGSLSQQVSSIDTKIESGFNYSKSNDPIDSDLKKSIKDVIPAFLEKSSYAGLCLIYAACLAHKKEKILDLNIFSNLILGQDWKKYFYGYLVASHSLNLFYAKNRNEDLTYTITETFKGLEKLVKKQIEEMSETQKEYGDMIKKITDFIETSLPVESESDSTENKD